MQHLTIACAACLMAGVVSAQGQTWIVDEQGGPGVSFTEIAPAVAAASNGDTILIRAGTYGSFTTGKALTMLGEGDVRVQVTSFVFPLPPVIEITGLAEGDTFVAKNLQVEFFNNGDGIALRNNLGRIHFEDVSCTRLSFPSLSGTGCIIGNCNEVTWTGGRLQGRPALSVFDSVVAASSMSIAGEHACGGAGCTAFGGVSSIAMTASQSQIWLSRTDVVGGSGAGIPSVPAAETGAAAIRATNSTMIVTGNAATRITAGSSSGISGPPQPIPAITTNGGTIDVDTQITVLGSGGGSDITGSAVVTRRRIVSVVGAAGPPGGRLTAEVVSPAGDLVNLVVSLPADPVALPIGTAFISPLVILPLFFGLQDPSGVTTIDVGIPATPALLGGTVALQAANFYQATSRVELSNPVVVVVF